MHFKTAFAMAAAIALASCSKHNHVTKNVDPFAEAHAAMKKELIDPDSARFEADAPARNGLGTCGLVNAKNSFGGYVGRQPYLYVRKTRKAVSTTAPTIDDLEGLWHSPAQGEFADDWQKKWTELQTRCEIAEVMKRDCSSNVATQIDTAAVCDDWQKSGWDIPKTLKARGASTSLTDY